MAALLLPVMAPAGAFSQDEGTAEVEAKVPFNGLDLSDMIPESVKLFEKLKDVEQYVKKEIDVADVEKKITVIKTNLKGLALHFQQMMTMTDYTIMRLRLLRANIDQEDNRLEDLSKILSNEIRKLVKWRDEWIEQKRRWDKWQSLLVRERELESVRSVTFRVNDTIGEALALLFSKLETILKMQVRVGDSQAEVRSLEARIDDLILRQQSGAVLNDSPPMVSRRFLSQFRSELWLAMKNAVNHIALPSVQAFNPEGWIALFPGFLSILLITGFYRMREVFTIDSHLRFLADRPVSAGLFVSTAITFPFYHYWGFPHIWKFISSIVMGISFVRISGGWVAALWKRQFIYGVIIIFIVNIILSVLGLPVPINRLFTVFTSVAGAYFLWHWAGKNRAIKGSVLFTLALRLGTVSLAFIILLEFSGRHGKADYLFLSLLYSLASVLTFMFFAYLIHGSLEWLFNASPFRRIAILYSNREGLIYRVGLILNIAGGFLMLCIVLTIWNFYPDVETALKSLQIFGISLGSQRITIGMMIASAAIFYCSFIASWMLQKMVVDEMLSRRRVEWGVRASILRLVHYAVITMGFLWAVSMIGFDLTKLTIVFGALGVGIGFGLQGIVNNFVSGLIMLFERPVRVRDWIEINGQWAVIQQIGLRATTIRTFDESEMVIPNTDLIANQVTNWTLTNRKARITIPVGVAYGSDVSNVLKTLKTCARANSMVAKSPEPEVMFMNFGDNSLDFQLRVWIEDIRDRLQLKSDLHLEIDRCFRESKIEIAFPQRDLHVRSIDESVISTFRKTAEES